MPEWFAKRNLPEEILKKKKKSFQELFYRKRTYMKYFGKICFWEKKFDPSVHPW